MRYTFFISYLILIVLSSCKSDEGIKLQECSPCVFKDSYGEHFSCRYEKSIKGYLYLEDSTKVWVELEGKGNPVLLIQGGPLFDHRYFHPHFSELAENNKLIYVDLRGRYMSDSSKSNKYSIIQDIIDYEFIREELGISEWSIIGHSYGGLLALLYAKVNPQTVNKVITVSTPLGIKEEQFDSVAKIVYQKYFKDVSTIDDNILAQEKLNFNQEHSDNELYYWRQTLKSYNNYDKFKKLNASYLDNSLKAWKNNLGPNFLELYDTLELKPQLISIIGKKDKLGFWEISQEFVSNTKSKVNKFKLLNNSSHIPWVDENNNFFDYLKKNLDKSIR